MQSVLHEICHDDRLSYLIHKIYILYERWKHFWTKVSKISLWKRLLCIFSSILSVYWLQSPDHKWLCLRIRPYDSSLRPHHARCINTLLLTRIIFNLVFNTKLTTQNNLFVLFVQVISLLQIAFAKSPDSVYKNCIKKTCSLGKLIIADCSRKIAWQCLSVDLSKMGFGKLFKSYTKVRSLKKLHYSFQAFSWISITFIHNTIQQLFVWNVLYISISIIICIIT